MNKLRVTITLIICFLFYSLLVYTRGTEIPAPVLKNADALAFKGKTLYQQKNCAACHQIYGLGGYLGPDLTTAFSDKNRGEAYMRAILQSGGSRMPNFQLTSHQINSIIAYLQYVDATAKIREQDH